MMIKKDDTYTEIVVVLDRSGSMESVKSDAIGGFNAFVEEQRLVPGEAKLTLVKFDHEYELAYESVPLSMVERLNENTFIPRGMTALLDAMGKSIGYTKEKIVSMPKWKRPDKVLIAVLTDGHENDSKEFNKKQVFDLVDKVQEEGWEILFLGADKSSIDEAASYGIKLCNTYSYDGITINHDGTTVSGTCGAYYTMSNNTTNYRLSGKKIK